MKAYVNNEREGYKEEVELFLKEVGEENIILLGDLRDKSNRSTLLTKLQGESKLLVLDMFSFEVTMLQFDEIREFLRQNNTEIVFYRKDEPTFEELIAHERYIIRKRTSEGLAIARENGRIGGRPKISQETAERIQFLYHCKNYTLRKIAEECEVSLGTAYKYTSSEVQMK